MENLIKLAEKGYSKSQYELGVKYAQMENYSSAFFWIKKAAVRGNIDAMNDLGLFYCNGQGCDVDYDKALTWWDKAADLGNLEAMYNLGVSYQNGEIVEKDLDKAKDLFFQAAQLGYWPATCALSNLNDEYLEDDEYPYEDSLVDKYGSNENEVFENEEFSYSIDVASKIYQKLKTQEEANNEFYEQLDQFFIKKGIKYECLSGSGIAGLGGVTYKSNEQTISVLVQFGDEPSVYGIVLPSYGAYTRQLFEEGYKNKYLFGLPIFRMQWFEEAERAFIYFINRKSYLEYDTPFGRWEKNTWGF